MHRGAIKSDTSAPTGNRGKLCTDRHPLELYHRSTAKLEQWIVASCAVAWEKSLSDPESLAVVALVRNRRRPTEDPKTVDRAWLAK